MKLLVDVNLSPSWIPFLCGHGHEARHWTEVGDARATDAQIMAWARDADCVVFTHDLDFGVLLALTKATGPSVMQVRAHDTLPSAIGAMVVSVLEEHAEALAAGALVTIDPAGSRLRILPIRE